MGAAARPEPLGSLQALAVPTLVLNGARDVTSRIASGLALASAVPGARHHVIADAGHLANFDDPAAYEAALRGFIAAIPEAAAPLSHFV
jgi:pimeloyl-ACP methyl ester carboxylesterase